VNSQQIVAAEIQQKQFAATTHTLNAPSGDFLTEGVWIGPRNAPPPENLCFSDAGSDKDSANLTRRIFNFR
jgi:hypothetical protein